MFAPKKTWRRWHRKTPVTMKRHAVASALAASAIPALVMARVHKIDEVPELPLVVSDGVEKVTKTKAAVDVLKKLGVAAELQKVKETRKIRAGKGKARNRRYVMRKGPLVIYKEDNGISRAFRNIPGVELCRVDYLNLLKLAPGGHMGRLIVWTESAMKELQHMFGSHKTGSASKKGYTLMRPTMTNSDLSRIINSDEVQSVVRPAILGQRRRKQHLNPLKNNKILARLNPVAMRRKKLERRSATVGTKQHKRVQENKKKNLALKKAFRKTNRHKYYKDLVAAFKETDSATA